MEQALDTAQTLFHRHGYDAVSMAMLTEALGINPPSFYAAFGSKAALFEQVLSRYAADNDLPMEQILSAHACVADGLGALLGAAAELYARDAEGIGCMVMEAARDAGESGLCETARRLRAESRQVVRDYVATQHPDQADMLADFTIITLTGLSSAARGGMGHPALVHAARIAAKGVAAELK